MFSHSILFSLPRRDFLEANKAAAATETGANCYQQADAEAQELASVPSAEGWLFGVTSLRRSSTSSLGGGLSWPSGMEILLQAVRRAIHKIICVDFFLNENALLRAKGGSYFFEFIQEK